MSWALPPRRDSVGSAAMAASAPPNSLTRARKVAGPTFSLRISLSQASRCRRLSRGPGFNGAEVLSLLLANARLLASRQPADIRRVTHIEKDREQQEQRSEVPSSR